jgi:hydrogenase expression/formation protein HypE
MPLQHTSRIVLGHGSGGGMTHDLIQRFFLPAFENPILKAGNDGGVLDMLDGQRLSVSVDCHVVWPLFFPGGDIGRLAICGTVNDVSAMGADPKYLTAGFILEEGLTIDTLQKVIASMQIAAEEAGVSIIAGDTKVVEKGKADQMYISTTGVGVVRKGLLVGGACAQPGDQVILTGSIGDHGMAVICARGELGFTGDLVSDVAPLNWLVHTLIDAVGDAVHVMRDPTRGGLATSLNEIARQSGTGIVIEEHAIPVKPVVQAACELLGFDPLYVANEGKLVIIVRADKADQALEAIRACQYGKEAVRIGEVRDSPKGMVLLKTKYDSQRVVSMLAGEMLPRIC